MKNEEVSEKSELDLILKENKQVLALFCSSWCPFCRSFFPAFNKGITKYSFERVIRVYLEDYDNPLWEEYSVEAVPTVILFEKAQVSSRLDAILGAGLSEKQFREWLDKITSVKS
jgi:thioredoxin 1